MLCTLYKDIHICTYNSIKIIFCSVMKINNFEVSKTKLDLSGLPD